MGNMTSSLDNEHQEASTSKSGRKEFLVAVTKEIHRASEAIQVIMSEFLDQKDEKICELEKKVHTLGDELKQKEIEIQECNKQIEEFKKQNSQNNLEITNLTETLHTLEKKYDEAKVDATKFKQLTDPTHEMRRRGQSVRPGDMTHEKVANEFKIIFADRQILKPIGVTAVNDRAELLIKMFECAYEVCKTHVIKQSTNEIAKLFCVPSHIYTIEEKHKNEIFTPWKSRQEALSLLMSADGEMFQPVNLTDEIVQKVLEMQLIDKVTDIENVITAVVNLSWSMVTLSPPITFSSLFPLSDDLCDLTNLEDVSKSDINNGKCSVVCRRPVLFFGPLGTVGEKGNLAVFPEKLHDKKDNRNMNNITHIEEQHSVSGDKDKETTQSVTDKKDLPQTFEDRGKICIGFEEIKSEEAGNFQGQENNTDGASAKKKKRNRKNKKKRNKEKKDNEEIKIDASLNDDSDISLD